MAASSHGPVEVAAGHDCRSNELNFVSMSLTACTMLTSMFVIGGFMGSRQLIQDIFNITVITMILCRRSIASLLQRQVYLWVVLSAGPCEFALWYLTMRKHAPSEAREVDRSPVSAPLRPMIFPCRTTHTRLFPKAHSLSYSYLLVGIPIGWNGSIGSILSSGCETASTWLSVRQEDYLARGTHPFGLRGKLNEYLIKQDVDPNSVPGAFLVTAPRLLGFSFNPVSFWYLYNSDMLLEYMILEVNNTFDERRIYLLERDIGKGGSKFKQEWKKDFHVSPFNDREGSYLLSAIDPFSLPDVVRVDNNIILSSPDGKPKLVARVFSTEKGFDASNFTKWGAVLFVFRWWWVGLMIHPRILREAMILWMKKLQVFYRPEVSIGSIGRNEMPEEPIFERAFRDWLQALAHTCQHKVIYISVAGPDRGKKQVFNTQNSESESQARLQRCIELEVLTPAFYSELARDGDIRQVFEARCFHSKPGEQMVHVNAEGLESLPALLTQEFSLEVVRETLEPTSHLSFSSMFNMHLRRGSSLLGSVYAATTSALRTRTMPDDEMESTRPSSFADYLPCVFKQAEDFRDFDRASTKLLLADRLALGSTALLRFYVTVTRWIIIVLAAWQIAPLVSELDYPDTATWLSLGFKFVILWLVNGESKSRRRVQGDGSNQKGSRPELREAKDMS